MTYRPVSSVYLLENTEVAEQILAETPFTVERETPKTRDIALYDTFESHAWANSQLVLKTSGQLSITDLTDGNLSGSCRFRRSPVSFMAAEINDEQVREKLATISGIRAFIKLAEYRHTEEQWRILDENCKTVAYLRLTTLSAGIKKKHDTIVLTLNPLRGYHDEVSTIRYAAEKTTKASSLPSLGPIYRDIFKRCGFAVNTYSAKPSVHLEKDSPVGQSARKMLRQTLQVMRTNEPWIAKEIDTEFLHDYRVAIRRTRSILAQLKGIFHDETIAPFRQGFRELAKRTNNLRDQDVYLLEADTLRAMLPERLRQGLEPFFEDLKKGRRTELGKFARYLATPHHAAFIKQWEAFLRNPHAVTRNEGSITTGDAAEATIHKAWKKVLRHGRSIGKEATDLELHALRLDCKKLRYLLEFFATVYPDAVITPAIKHLKNLQDNLGSFVDLSVQQDYLYQWLASSPRGRNNPETAASLGGLIALIGNEREKVRARFHKTFRRFDSEETEHLFRQLFHQKG